MLNNQYMHNNTNTKNNINSNINNTNNNTQYNKYGPHNAIRAIYQYSPLSLYSQIQNRIYSQTQFEQQQLWAILATLVQSLSYLQSQQIAYGVLGTDKIFINTNSLIKILDPSATACDPLLITQGRLYSPQILNGEQNINIFKSDIYVIGLILIQCGLLVDLSKDREPNLQKYINIFKQQYSKELLEIIEKCLINQVQNRPNFQQLIQDIGKQLNWNQFSNNYQIYYNSFKNNKICNILQNDKQDLPNQKVQQILIQYQQCNYDILYQSLSKDELNMYKYKKMCLSEYQRAKIKYLGINYNNINNKQESSNSKISQYENQNSYSQSDIYQSRRSNSQKNKYKYHNYINNRVKDNSSPKETKRNHKYSNSNSIKYKEKDIQNNKNLQNIYQQYYQDKRINNINYHNKNKNKLPNFNMAISQSVYTEGPSSMKNHYQYNNHGYTQNYIQKTNRKTPRDRQDQYQNYIPKKSSQSRDRNRDRGQRNQQYMSFGDNLQIPSNNMSKNTVNMQKIKKTKLIKEKLVRNPINSNNNIKQDVNQTFGMPKNKNIQESKNVQHPNFAYNPQNINTFKQVNNNNNNNRYNNQSIQQQLYQQSQSSYLYYNNNSSRNTNNNQNANQNTNINIKQKQSQSQNSKTNSIQESRTSQNNSINTNNNMKNSGIIRQSCNFQHNNNINLNLNQQKYITMKPLNQLTINTNIMNNINDNQNLFTDPNLMKTIKDDLARISTTKNIRKMEIVGNMKENKYYK